MQSTLGFSLFSFFGFYFCLSFPTLSVMVRKTRANKKTTSNSTSTPAFDSDRFRFEKNQKAYEKLNIFRSVWAERKVVLDELDPKIMRNFKCRGWLSLLYISHPPSTVLIREFYSNLWPLQWFQHSLCDDLDKEWRVYHYSFNSGLCSWGTFGTTTNVPIWWDPSSWSHYVISHRYFHSVGYWSSYYLL